MQSREGSRLDALANRVIQRSLVPGVRDTQCGFKAFTAESARALFGIGRIDGWAFDLEILALARRTGFAIAEVGVEWTDDRRSRVHSFHDLWKVVREATTFRKNLRRGVTTRSPLLRDHRARPDHRPHERPADGNRPFICPGPVGAAWA